MAFPYRIKNSSVFFPIKVSQWHCVMNRATVGDSEMTNVDAGKGNDVFIASHSSTNYKCGIEIIGYHVRNAVLTVTVSYRNLFHHLKDGQVSKCFQWIDAGASSAWVEGCENH
jgi:hypothetical protein